MYTNNKLSKAVHLAMAFGAASTAVFAASASAQEASEGAKVERIEVTGSRIKRIGELAPTPVTVITGDALVDAGVTNVADLLHKMPSASVGSSPETTNNTIFASGLNNTDLRGLGSNRTLVLVNGRRFIAGAPGSGAVDLNNIPTSMIERMEITTGGASAVYGSDAIAGVVNIITKKSFDGIEIDVSTARTEQSGGEEEFASLTFGGDVGKWSFINNFNLSRQKQLRGDQRDFMLNAPITIANPALVGYDGDEVLPGRIVWGHGTTSIRNWSKTGNFTDSRDGQRYTFDADGNLKKFAEGPLFPAGPAGTTNLNNYYGRDGDGYDSVGHAYLRTPLTRLNFASIANYEFNADHSMTVEVNYSKTKAYGESSPAFVNFVVDKDNAFLSDEAKAIIAAQPDGKASFSYLAQDFGNRKYVQDRNLARVALGFQGVISDSWSYDAYATTAHVQSDTTWFGELLEQNLYNAIDAVNLNGNIVCAERATYDFSREEDGAVVDYKTGDVIGAKAGCAPLNVFGRGLYDEDAYNSVSTDASRKASIGQTVVGVSVSGDIVELPAGYLSAAFSAEYRDERAKTMPDPAMRAGLLFGNRSEPMNGDFNVREVAAEFSVPLLEGIFLADSLIFETAVRYMDYSTSGSDNAWKLGINWAVTDELRVRASKSKSVRAPNIGELYSPPGQTFRSFNDPCAASEIAKANPVYKDNIIANCGASGVPVGWEPSDTWKQSNNSGYSKGNANLTNEIANDITVGFVYTPSFIENFSITLDYWQFDLENLIQSFTGPNLVKYCYQAASLDNPYCPLIERNETTSEIDNYFEMPVNSATSKVSGVDVEMAYRFSTEIGEWDLRLISTYLDNYEFNTTGLAEDLVVSTGEQARPRWRHRFSTTYRYGDFSAVMTVTHRSATVNDRQWSLSQNNYNDISSYTQFDLTSRYDVTPALQLRAGLLNIFDREPPANPFSYNNSNGYYDSLGRRLTLGMNYSF
ncbi:TonB-dependent receptor [Chromatiaceae bacterium AAb-1]|nr:TonB-dependent receptor [Chromatiaceae bacterium AAb-1]